jgi:Protein of unknown function (DUF3995)
VTTTVRTRAAWAGYAAFAVGLLYTLVSLYWAIGGTALLDTLGGKLEEMARAREPGLIAIVWVTVVLKLVASLLGLALVQSWGRRLPRWMLRTAAWGATIILVLYGGYLVVGQVLVETGVLDAPAATDWKAFRWHLYLWDPWFLIWGVLLGVAAIRGRNR